jgi:mono/diheme cytochrome c family protein
VPAFRSFPRNRKSGAAILIAIAVSALTGQPVCAQEATPEQIDQGRELYHEICATCHGRDMVSAGTVTFDLRQFPKDDSARFRNAVLNGKGQGMPPWRDKISDEDVTLLWAYVRSGGG